MNYNKIMIEQKIKQFIMEDCNFKDCSSQFIPDGTSSKAKIIAKSDGYISGLEELQIMFNVLNVESTLRKKDGDAISKGDVIIELKGDTKSILLGERVGLNLCTHMSEVTSTTRLFVDIVEKSQKKTKIACTRKTLPGLRIFDKKAVEIGGGDTHRFSLDDMILLKDTHLRYKDGDVVKLLKDVKKTASFSKKIEIELEKVEDVLIAARNGADIIMLDNMNPQQVGNAISSLVENNLREKVIIEISGGINRTNILDYLVYEPDIISSSEITQNPSVIIDLSLKFN
ncbi:MAG: carboxylating nicotinate-nucleotide diphosphorylase [Promethearchaeota archaeon]